MNYRLLAVDLDGTLLSDQETISDKNLNSLKKADKKGVQVVITTGRSYNSAHRYIHALGMAHPTITYNGAVITKETEVMKRVALNNRIIGDLIKLLKDMSYPPIIYLPDNKKYYETFGRYSEDFLSFSKGFENDLVKVDNLAARTWEDVIRISVVTGKHDVTLLHAELKHRFGRDIRTVDTYFPAWNFWLFEILHTQCSKSKGLEYLCEEYGISQQEVIAVGDNNNDIDMINWAGLGCAMKNGLDAVIMEADYVTEKTNNEDGVAEVIERFIL
jgi:Cof subfamily protein (haloacid dehalogenase superfamily)